MPKTTPNRELVVFTLHLLDGAVNRVHTEDIAREAHKLFPDSFSWTKYPDLPDKETVRIALSDARKAKYGSLVEGRAGQHRGQFSKTKRDPQPDGWTLTEAGVKWILLNQKQIESLVGSAAGPKLHRQKVLKQLARIKDHRLFADFVRDRTKFNPDIGELAELLRCRVDAPQEVWAERLEGIRRKAQISKQEEILRFVGACETAYRAQI